MDIKEFRSVAPKVIDYVVNYLDSLSKRSVSPDVPVGYLTTVLPPTAPDIGESFDKILEELDKYIMPGLTHWQHPTFFAHYATSSSYSSIISELFKIIFGGDNYSGPISLALFELNTVMMDWYGKLVGLPNSFLRYAEESSGGAVMDNTADDCILQSMICARKQTLKQISEKQSIISMPVIISSLVAYFSDEAHSRVMNAAMISMVTVEVLETDENFRLRGDTLKNAIEEHEKIGFIPFFVNVTIGTPCGVCDSIEEIGPICEKYGLWLHVDAAYAGTTLMCQEFKPFLNGIEYASSINVNPTMWMLVHEESAILFVKDFSKLEDTLMVDKTKFDYSLAKSMCNSAVASRSLKMWFVMELYGVERLQNHIRRQIQLAKIFADSVRSDSRFEILTSQLGIVCFRLNKSNAVNKCLLDMINASRKILLSFRQLKGKFVIRFTISNECATEGDVKYAWALISECTDKVIQNDEKTSASTASADA